MFDSFDAQKEAERILKVVSEILIEEKKKHESNEKKDSLPVISIVSDNI